MCIAPYDLFFTRRDLDDTNEIWSKFGLLNVFMGRYFFWGRCLERPPKRASSKNLLARIFFWEPSYQRHQIETSNHKEREKNVRVQCA